MDNLHQKSAKYTMIVATTTVGVALVSSNSSSREEARYCKLLSDMELGNYIRGPAFSVSHTMLSSTCRIRQSGPRRDHRTGVLLITFTNIERSKRVNLES